MSVVVVSFDGVGDQAFEAMAGNPSAYPHIAAFMEQAHYQGSVKTIFVSNTYPIHATISTGKLPVEHGIISNYTDAEGGLRWAQRSRYIQAETIWDLCSKQGLSTAAILWPITCGAEIRWNLPEVHLHGWENQLVESLRHGSRRFQIWALLKHITSFRGIAPPNLDRFTTAVTCDLLRRKRPDLTLLHLIAYDSVSHRTGSQAPALESARKSLDACLGKILDAAGDATVLIFSDHAHLDVHTSVDLHALFGEVLLEQCGGSAFFSGPLEGLEAHPWFERFLTQPEMEESGFFAKGAQVGIAAKPGYRFGSGHYRSDHGYPVDYENYRVFYALRNSRVPVDVTFGDVRDITGILFNELGISP